MYVKNISSTWNSFNQQKENKQTNVLKKTNQIIFKQSIIHGIQCMYINVHYYLYM